MLSFPLPSSHRSRKNSGLWCFLKSSKTCLTTWTSYFSSRFLATLLCSLHQQRMKFCADLFFYSLIYHSKGLCQPAAVFNLSLQSWLKNDSLPEIIQSILCELELYCYCFSYRCLCSMAHRGS